MKGNGTRMTRMTPIFTDKNIAFLSVKIGVIRVIRVLFF